MGPEGLAPETELSHFYSLVDLLDLSKHGTNLDETVVTNLMKVGPVNKIITQMEILGGGRTSSGYATVPNCTVFYYKSLQLQQQKPALTCRS